jgi:hypothetical protein
MELSDGSISFIGGMDASKPPYLLEQGYYHRGCNLSVSHSSGKLTQRHGWQHIDLIGDEEAICLYRCAKNYQAEGWYKSGSDIIMLRMVDGWLLQFKRVTNTTMRVSLLNKEDRRNPNLSKAWIATVPKGAIVNDGEGRPFVVSLDSIRRTNPANDEIGVGRMGVYVQNRFFYVDPSGKYIFVSDFRNPSSVLNAKLANIQGFILPEDQGEISAIGVRKQALNYVDGGVLAFSTPNNTYSVDVRGDIQNWEVANTGLGKVQESLPGIGAISSYSYESFSSDLYFRSLDQGINNIGYLESQFGSGISYTSQSTEILCWLDRDTKRLLSKCYTRKFGHRLLTTVAPTINKHGYVYWEGLVSTRPSPIYNGQRGPDVYEGLWTGVRPWGMTSYQDALVGIELFVDSYDADGVTRMYQLTDKLDHDVDRRGNKVEIKSWLETKSFNFGDFPTPKKIENRSYTISDIPRTLRVKAHSRKESFGPWVEFSDKQHLVSRINLKANKFGLKTVLDPVSSSPQQRMNVSLATEQESKDVVFSGMGGGSCYSRQYRLEFTGAFSLENFLVQGSADTKSMSATVPEKEEKIIGQKPLLDYSYLIETP